jgi:hypothetical protein
MSSASRRSKLCHYCSLQKRGDGISPAIGISAALRSMNGITFPASTALPAQAAYNTI